MSLDHRFQAPDTRDPSDFLEIHSLAENDEIMSLTVLGIVEFLRL